MVIPSFGHPQNAVAPGSNYLESRISSFPRSSSQHSPAASSYSNMAPQYQQQQRPPPHRNIANTWGFGPQYSAQSCERSQQVSEELCRQRAAQLYYDEQTRQQRQAVDRARQRQHQQQIQSFYAHPQAHWQAESIMPRSSYSHQVELHSQLSVRSEDSKHAYTRQEGTQAHSPTSSVSSSRSATTTRLDNPGDNLNDKYGASRAGFYSTATTIMGDDISQSPSSDAHNFMNGKHKSKSCSIPGCLSKVRTKGLCIAHGGGKRCSVAGCTSGARPGGKCVLHGGGKRCVVRGCNNSAQRKGVCVRHFSFLSSSSSRPGSVSPCDRAEMLSDMESAAIENPLDVLSEDIVHEKESESRAPEASSRKHYQGSATTSIPSTARAQMTNSTTLAPPQVSPIPPDTRISIPRHKEQTMAQASVQRVGLDDNWVIRRGTHPAYSQSDDNSLYTWKQVSNINTPTTFSRDSINAKSPTTLLQGSNGIAGGSRLSTESTKGCLERSAQVITPLGMSNSSRNNYPSTTVSNGGEMRFTPLVKSENSGQLSRRLPSLRQLHLMNARAKDDREFRQPGFVAAGRMPLPFSPQQHLTSSLPSSNDHQESSGSVANVKREVIA